MNAQGFEVIMKRLFAIVLFFGSCVFLMQVFFLDSLAAETNIYDLRRLTDEDWLSMTTEQRLDALNTSNNRAKNQTFVGNFNQYYDDYNRWGYDYYEMSDRYENYSLCCCSYVLICI